MLPQAIHKAAWSSALCTACNPCCRICPTSRKTVDLVLSVILSGTWHAEAVLLLVPRIALQAESPETQASWLCPYKLHRAGRAAAEALPPARLYRPHQQRI